MITDSHLHLDNKRFRSAFEAAGHLNKDRVAAGINNCLVLHLLNQGWTVGEFIAALEPFSNLYGLINLLPSDPECKKILKESIASRNIIGLKLHPRVQKFSLLDQNVTDLVEYAGDINCPVLIDAFPDGTILEQGFSPLAYAKLARRCPNTNIVIAHMGGHYVLDFMMLAKRIPNIYFDLSYSFLYYRGSSIPQNMAYAMRSLRYERVMYGSDYPDRSLKETLQETLKLFEVFGI